MRVTPRARKEALAGEREGALLVRLTAPPLEGAANAALVTLLGKALGLPRSSVRIVGGERGRTKTVVLAGLDAATVRTRLESERE